MYNIIFLGDRRIAQEAIMLIHEYGKDIFSIKVLVSSAAFYEGCVSIGIEIPVFIDNMTNNEEKILEVIAEQEIDILISVQHNWILTSRLLKSVNFRAFNLHNAKLPNYKGYNSISHAIVNGDKNYYTTIHWMVAKVDSGDIAYEAIIPIEQNETALSLYRKSIVASIKNFKMLLYDLSNGRLPPKKIIEGDGVFYKREDLTKIKDVTKSSMQKAEQIARAVFFPPHEPAFIENIGDKIYLIPNGYLDANWKEKPALYNCNWNKTN